MKAGKNIKLIRSLAAEIAARFPEPVYPAQVRRRIARIAKEGMMVQIIESITPTHMARLHREWRKAFADVRPKMTTSTKAEGHS